MPPMWFVDGLTVSNDFRRLPRRHIENNAFEAGGDTGEDLDDRLLKPTKVTLFTTIFFKFWNQQSRYKVILSSIVLSQRCCKVYFIPLTFTETFMRLDYQILLKSPLQNVLVGSAPGLRTIYAFYLPTNFI